MKMFKLKYKNNKIIEENTLLKNSLQRTKEQLGELKDVNTINKELTLRLRRLNQREVYLVDELNEIKNGYKKCVDTLEEVKETYETHTTKQENNHRKHLEISKKISKLNMGDFKKSIASLMVSITNKDQDGNLAFLSSMAKKRGGENDPNLELDPVD